MQVGALSVIPFEATRFVGLGEVFINSAIRTAVKIRGTLKITGHFPTWFCLYLGVKQPNIAWGFKYFKLYASLQKEPEVTKGQENTHSDPIFSGRWSLYICMQTRLTWALQGSSTLQGVICISFTLHKFCGFLFVVIGNGCFVGFWANQRLPVSEKCLGIYGWACSDMSRLFRLSHSHRVAFSLEVRFENWLRWKLLEFLFCFVLNGVFKFKIRFIFSF